jgi:hypothetical protein
VWAVPGGRLPSARAVPDARPLATQASGDRRHLPRVLLRFAGGALAGLVRRILVGLECAVVLPELDGAVVVELLELDVAACETMNPPARPPPMRPSAVSAVAARAVRGPDLDLFFGVSQDCGFCSLSVFTVMSPCVVACGFRGLLCGAASSAAPRCP